jgi:hypothetical protein
MQAVERGDRESHQKQEKKRTAEARSFPEKLAFCWFTG